MQGRKASAAPSFVLDATGMQELLDAAAARKQTGDAAPSVAKRTGTGKAAAAGSTRLRRAMEADFQGAGTAEGRQRPGTALGLKRKVAAMAAAPSVPGTTDPAAWYVARDNNLHPPGGFTRLVSNPPQNIHFVGPTAYSSPPIVVTQTPHLNQNSINLDSGDEVARTEKRILWTQEEDVRLMSAWLKNSTDPINGADRRNEQYWGDVVKTYNMTTPKHRTRNQKQAKDRWHKSNQTEENPIDIEDENVHDLPRPMGQKKAKKMALDSKKEGKSRESAIDVEQLEKYSQLQSEVHANRLQVLEVQQKLSSEKLEASRLNHLAALESKEAKMLETYNSLLLKDTGGYSAEEKDEHLVALRCLRKRLFPED